MAFISVTRLRIRRVFFLPQFFWHTSLSLRQAKRASGNLQVKVFNSARWTFWTMTAWEDQSAMRAFMVSGSHKTAMPKLMHWCDEASVGHWQQESAALPDWPEAHRRMVAEGRLSKVHHPSAAHLAGQIGAPN